MRLLKGVHVHVPRTGGNTVRMTVGQHLHLFSHDAVSSIIKRFEPKQWESIYKFGIVRNPWSRAYSSYILHSMMRQDRKAKFKPTLDWQREDFHDWLHETEKESNWFTALTPQKLYTLRDGSCPLDHIYKFEDGTPWYCRHIASVIGAELPLGKISKHKHGNLPRHDYRGVIVDAADRELIAEIGAWEIDRYGYCFAGDGLVW